MNVPKLGRTASDREKNYRSCFFIVSRNAPEAPGNAQERVAAFSFPNTASLIIALAYGRPGACLAPFRAIDGSDAPPRRLPRIQEVEERGKKVQLGPPPPKARAEQLRQPLTREQEILRLRRVARRRRAAHLERKSKPPQAPAQGGQ